MTLINYRLLKFANNTKLFGPVSSVEEVDKILEDLIKLSSWSSEWLMLFNIDKCNALHIHKINTKVNYEMRGNILLFERGTRLRCHNKF